MTESEVITYIHSRFASNWISTPVEYMNMDLNKDTLSEWVRFTVRQNTPIRLGFGTSTKRMGHVSAQVFVKERLGFGRGLELAELAGSIFGMHINSTLVFEPYAVSVIGNTASQLVTSNRISWHQTNMSADYSFIES